MAVHGDNIVCLSNDDGLKSIDSLLKSKCTAKDLGTLLNSDSDVKSLLLLNRVFTVGTDQTGQHLDAEPDLRHAPPIVNEPGSNSNNKTVSTSREKLQDKLVLDERRSPIPNREDTTRYRSACTRLSYWAQDRLDLAETTKQLAQRMSEPRDFDFVPLKRQRTTQRLASDLLQRIVLFQSSLNSRILGYRSKGQSSLTSFQHCVKIRFSNA